jgi:uncharacterized protein YjbJ (UPF0337 family)
MSSTQRTIAAAQAFLEGIQSMTRRHSMNKHQDEGLSKQVKGTVKDVAGKLTGDKILQGEGKIEKTAGKIQKEIGNAQARHDRADPARRPV